MDVGIIPEVICTDLDGNSEADIEKEILACETGSIVLIHRMGTISISLKNMCFAKAIYCNYQARTFDKVYNFGEPHQGDRCLFFAMEFRIKTVKLTGFDFDDSRVNTVKKKKLK